jgi:hypothetical protein
MNQQLAVLDCDTPGCAGLNVVCRSGCSGSTSSSGEGSKQRGAGGSAVLPELVLLLRPEERLVSEDLWAAAICRCLSAFTQNM